MLTSRYLYWDRKGHYYFDHKDTKKFVTESWIHKLLCLSCGEKSVAHRIVDEDLLCYGLSSSNQFLIYINEDSEIVGFKINDTLLVTPNRPNAKWNF